MLRFILAASVVLSLASVGQADICNKDNCLNALASPTRNGTAFCSTFTGGGGGPIPTYMPTTCSPQRVSSACYCVDNVGNPRYTPAPCPKGNVVANPSFYGQAGSPFIDIRPWVIAAGEASTCGVINGYSISSQFGQWGDPRAIACGFNQTLGGKSTVSQDLKLCPSAKYHFRMGSSSYGYIQGQTANYGNMTFRVLFAGTQILSPRTPSPRCWDKSRSDYVGPDACRNVAYYEYYDVNFTAPSSGKGTLVIEVNQPQGLKGYEAPMLIDTVFVNLVGDSDTSDPAGPCCCGAC